MAFLQNFSVMDTRHLDEARRIVGGQFCSHQLELQSLDRHFHARHFMVPGCFLSLNYLAYGDRVLIEPGELETFYLIHIPMHGTATIENGGVMFTSHQTQASILNPDRHTRMVWHADCEQLMVYLPKHHLQTIAEASFQRAIPGKIVFHPQIDLTEPNLAQLRNYAIAFAREADQGQLFGSSKNINQVLYEETFVTTLLQHQPSNIACFIKGGSGSIASKETRRARQYIVENAHRPIAMSDVVRAANIPARTLQHQFRHFYQVSPIEFLKQERLNNIHAILASGHCAERLECVAAAWGFSHMGRFSHYYKQQFGQLPSKTRADANADRCHSPKSNDISAVC